MSAVIIRFPPLLDLRKAEPKRSLWQRLRAWFKPMKPFENVPAHKPRPAKVFQIHNPHLLLAIRRRSRKAK